MFCNNMLYLFISNAGKIHIWSQNGNAHAHFKIPIIFCRKIFPNTKNRYITYVHIILGPIIKIACLFF